MAEIARYGRRKQRNPKRKNVEDEVNDKTNKDSKPEPANEKIVNGIHDNSNHSDDDADAESNHDNETAETTNNDEQLHDNSVKNDDDTQNHSPDVNKSDLGETAPKNGKGDTPADVSEIPPAAPPCMKDTTEDEKIQEYLNRSDTAVIFPESVSDNDDEEEEDGDNCNQNGNPENDSSCNTDEEIPLKCVHCDQTYLRASLLREHMKVSHPDKQIKYLCPKCDETFLMKSHLDKHLALHSPTCQSCKVCNKTFANVYRLQRHMISHDESTDLRKFKCPECGKAFKFKHHLKEHIRIHSGEKPFQCPNCGKRFSHSGSYSSHMTSKKCWVMNQNKGRQFDREGSSEPNVGFSPARAPVSGMDSSLHSPSPGTFPHPFVHFDPRKTGIPPYYSPPTGTYTYIPVGALPVSQSTPLKTIMPTTVSAHTQMECILPPTYTPSSHSNHIQKQISPDVNSNTKLISVQNNQKVQEPAIKMEEGVATNKVSNCETPVKPMETSAIKTEPTENKDSNSCQSLQCRYCGSSFSSAVEQHQHERYICKLNKEVVHQIHGNDSARDSPCSTISERSHQGTPSGSVSAGTDEEQLEEMYKDENNSADKKTFRMRSLISDEQLQVLKAHYQVNPRPRKYELIRIGNEIGFPKRVVQVWFQNMRARDRRRGKNVPYFPSMARFKRQENQNSIWKDQKASPNFIAVVPTPFAHGGKVNGNITSSIKPTVSEEQPLDLSVRSKPPSAHSGSRPASITPPAGQTKDQVLNLSKKSEDGKTDGSLQNSAIYKYMQQEGLFSRHFMVNPLVAAPLPQSTLIRPMSAGPLVSKQESPVTTTLSDTKPSEQEMSSTSPITESKNGKTTPLNTVDENVDTNNRLVIDENNDDSSESDSDEENSMSSNTSHYNTLLAERAMADATQNLATLAEVSLAARAAVMSDSMGKSKRLRKKSWRQVQAYMESEEINLDLDESLLDDDHPFKKKRKSWKNHRLDTEEGLYACDQCKKMFSKQSSLARHKYEHSGARPFTCQVCGKAFKHKHHLTEHCRLHSGEKPFQCKKCGKRFSHSGSYSQHMNHRYKYCKPSRGEIDTDASSP
ncbi:hypothetical protein KUTeg_015648 [Tegillarca granosa]|uniref:Uncharacterized protein n=1 Tax=Tegillarca granosa TaxID=220873 RepID=A0ABQ9EQS0_TEGGR|nr:hypothetical protein KUTeg_015648 [Tegillarca granosa]